MIATILKNFFGITDDRVDCFALLFASVLASCKRTLDDKIKEQLNGE